MSRTETRRSRTCESSAAPSAVSSTPLGVRLTSFASVAASSRRRLLLTAGTLSPSACAARPRCLCSAMTPNTRCLAAPRRLPGVNERVTADNCDRRVAVSSWIHSPNLAGRRRDGHAACSARSCCCPFARLDERGACAKLSNQTDPAPDAAAPGAANDALMRAVAAKLSELLAQQVVLENRPGAGITIAPAIAAKATPDGYTLLHCAISDAIAPALVQRLPFDLLRDFSPVSLVSTAPNILMVHPSIPAKSVRSSSRAPRRIRKDGLRVHRRWHIIASEHGTLQINNGD